MRVDQRAFLSILATPDTQFAIPPFQRVYSWTAFECRELLQDILQSGREGGQHFLGAFLYSPLEALQGLSHRYQVIDGQQRLTTMTLLMIAYEGHLRAQGDRGRADGIREQLLCCGPEGSWPKLLMTSIDRDMLAYLLGLAPEPEDVAARLGENLELFRQVMADPGFDGDAFWVGCMNLQAVAMELGPQDSPQEVFESLNSKGKRLAIEDLVRNALLLGSKGRSDGMELYERRWLPLEEVMDAIPDADMEDLICAWMAKVHGDEKLDSKSRVYPLLKQDLALTYYGDYGRLLDALGCYGQRFAADAQFRRDALAEADRWLQGKPKNLVSEHRMFGD